MSLNNFGLIAPGFARGAQPDEKGFKDLINMGYTLAYKLNSDSEFPVALEAASFHPGQVQSNPVNMWNPFRPGIIESVHEIEDWLAQGQKIYIHCTHGRDRTGLMVGAYRILHDKWTIQAVMAERAEYGAVGLVEFADHEIVEFLQKLALNPA